MVLLCFLWFMYFQFPKTIQLYHWGGFQNFWFPYMEILIFICFHANLSWNHWKKLMELFVYCEEEKTPKTRWEKEEKERYSRCQSRASPTVPGKTKEEQVLQCHPGRAQWWSLCRVPWWCRWICPQGNCIPQEGLMLEQGKSLKRKGKQRKPLITWSQPPHSPFSHTTQGKEVEELGMRDQSWSWEEEGVTEICFRFLSWV